MSLSVCFALPLPAKLRNFKLVLIPSGYQHHAVTVETAKGSTTEAVRVTTFISCVPNFLSYFPTVIMTPTIINCLRGRQSVAFQKRFSSRYSTPFDNPSNVSFATRGLGTARKAGSNSHMYAENGDSSCSHRLHVCTYGSSSRSTDLEWGLRYESYAVSRPCR